MSKKDIELAIGAILEQVQVLKDVADSDPQADEYGGTIHFAATQVLETVGDLLSVNSGRLGCVLDFAASNIDLHLHKDGTLYDRAVAAIGRRHRRLMVQEPKLRMAKRLTLQA